MQPRSCGRPASTRWPHYRTSASAQKPAGQKPAGVTTRHSWRWRVRCCIEPAQIAAGDVWVALAGNGSVAGVLALAATSEPGTLDLDKLFIEPRHIRGGFGRVLMDWASAEARRRGATRLTILADPNAAAFYERCGAQPIGEAPSDAIPGRVIPLLEVILG
jgi:GNAT superfamily N-acetyltransferase